MHQSGLVALSRVDGKGEGKESGGGRDPIVNKEFAGAKSVYRRLKVERGPSQRSSSSERCCWRQMSLSRVRHQSPKSQRSSTWRTLGKREREGRARDQAIPSFLPSSVPQPTCANCAAPASPLPLASPPSRQLFLLWVDRGRHQRSQSCLALLSQSCTWGGRGSCRGRTAGERGDLSSAAAESN